MSIRMMSLIWELELPDSEKLVALALADWSNDQGESWPSISQLAKKCSKSERTVQAVTASLEKKGLIVREMRPGKGCKYYLHPRNHCTPAETAPPQPLHPAAVAPVQPSVPTPAAVAPNTSRTTNTSEAKASSVKRATRLPDDFQVPASWKAWARLRRSWSQADVDDEAEAFVDYWQSKPGSAARKLDWEKTWHNWARNSRRNIQFSQVRAAVPI